jgi:hypothetical protein
MRVFAPPDLLIHAQQWHGGVTDEGFREMMQNVCARIIALLAIAALSACSPPSSNSEGTTSKGECVEPSNPWAGDGGGHEAGFNWAQQSGEECPSDHGASFEEGCTEFHNQRRRHEECEAAK